MHEFILRKLASGQDRDDQGPAQLFFNLRSMKPGLNTLSHDEVKAMAARWASSPRKSSKWKLAWAARTVALEP